MSELKIVATVTVCEQVGESTFVDRHFSRVFHGNRTIDDLLSFAKQYVKNPLITDIKISEYTGESL